MTDWAQEIQILLDVDYVDAEKVILICDNLNTHRIAALYVAFEPQGAKHLRDVWKYVMRPRIVLGSILLRLN